MTNDTQLKLENKFLAILDLYTDRVYDLIQIKDFYFTNSVNQKLFNLLVSEYETKGLIDDTCILNKLNRTEIDHYTNAMSDSDIPVANITQHFEEIQRELFINYKKRLTEDIYQKYKNGKITFENYLKKLDIIQDALIEDEDGVMTKEEFDKNISTELIRIPLEHFKKLNETLELVQNDFLVIGANTGTGKSGLLLNLMNDLIEKYQCIYFNMEMSKSTIYKRMLSIRADIPIKSIDNPTEYQTKLIEQAKKDYIDNKVRIIHRISNIDEIENFIRRRKNKQQKHTVVFLDHLGLIENGSNKSLYERITQVMQRLRQICLKYDCTIISACQLNRSSYGAEQLDLSMLKDSGEIENSASKIILLYRCKDFDKDHLEPEMILDVCKNRDGMLNKIVAIYGKKKQVFTEKGY